MGGGRVGKVSNQSDQIDRSEDNASSDAQAEARLLHFTFASSAWCGRLLRLAGARRLTCR